MPPIAPETPDEQRRAREAQLRRDNRLAERERIETERGGLDGRSERVGVRRASVAGATR